MNDTYSSYRNSGKANRVSDVILIEMKCYGRYNVGAAKITCLTALFIPLHYDRIAFVPISKPLIFAKTLKYAYFNHSSRR